MIKTAVSLKYFKIKINYNKKSVLIKHIIKFLLISFQFKALYNKFNILIKRLLIIFIKLTINILIIKIKINIVTNTVKNKIYKYNKKALIILNYNIYIII